MPGLRYALQKGTSSSWGDAVSTSIRIKQHFQEYAELDQNTQPTSGQNSEVPLSSLLSPTEDECTNPFKKCSEQSFAQLRRYLSDPSSYTLEMSAALGCLTGAVQSLCGDSEADCKVDFSSAVPPDPIPPNTAAEIKVKSENPKPTVGLGQGGEGPAKDVNSASKLWVQQSRRKSSQAVVTSTRRKWSPLKMQMHPVGDSGRNRKATKKKKINISFSFPKKPGLMASSNEPMLKLANLQFPHRRKRGKCYINGTDFLLLLQGIQLGYPGFTRSHVPSPSPQVPRASRHLLRPSKQVCGNASTVSCSTWEGAQGYDRGFQ